MRHAIFLSAIVAVSCGGHAAEPTATASANPSAVLEPVFDCYRANSAWGFALSGKFIDKNGKVWSYGKRGQAWLPALVKDGDAVYLTAKDLRAKFVEAKESGSIDAKALLDKTELITKAGQGKLTRTDTGVRDAGTSACHAYVSDLANERYQDIDLGSDNSVSDLRSANDAPEAKVILTWLQSVGVAN